jgi:hypothetical protein
MQFWFDGVVQNLLIFATLSVNLLAIFYYNFVLNSTDEIYLVLDKPSY